MVLHGQIPSGTSPKKEKQAVSQASLLHNSLRGEVVEVEEEVGTIIESKPAAMGGNPTSIEYAFRGVLRDNKPTSIEGYSACN